MARKRDPRRDQAFEIFKEHAGNIELIAIAEKLNVSAGTVRGWKSKDKWEQKLNGTLQSEETERSKKRGAPLGNQNGKGNCGNSKASPPANNKNAVKTGEYETIFFDTLSDDEKDIYSNLSDDPFFVLSEEIKLLKIRQRRMMQRISEAEKGLGQKDEQVLYELRGRKEVVEKSGKRFEIPGKDQLQITERKEKIYRKINDILSIEEALTRISNQLTRSIRELEQLNLNVHRKELMQAELKKVSIELGPTPNPTDRITVILGDEIDDEDTETI